MFKSISFFILSIFLFVSQTNAFEEEKSFPSQFEITYPKSMPEVKFLGEYGTEVSIQDFKGKVILLNVWATTCARCMIELPMLDKLQREMGSMKFQVVALSTGLETLPKLRKILFNRNASNLKVYSDPRSRFAMAADVRGLPTTFLINEDGYSVGQIRGIADWNNEKIKQQIRELILEGKEKREAQKRQEALDNDVEYQAKLRAEAEALEAQKRQEELENIEKQQRINEMSSWFKK